MRRFAPFVLIIIVMLFVPLNYTHRTENNIESFNSPATFVTAEENEVENPGFETGSFSPWVDVESVTENQIQSSIVHSGSYALRMDSIYFTWAFVEQEFESPLSLTEASQFSAAIYPTDTGVTCGAYGRAAFTLFVNNTETGVTRLLYYVWSGYDYPGTDTGSNVTRAHFLFYDWSPNQWHILERTIVSDYEAVFGETDASLLEITMIRLENHASNGEPGTFYLDDVSIILGDGGEDISEWKYRKSHLILGSTGAGTDYQVRLVVNYGYGIDSGDAVYCNSKCQTDFDDIRFTDDDGVTMLDYWRESYEDSDSAVFWVEVMDNLDYNNSIYMYYGNEVCSSTSNGTNTFIFFDDYEENNLERWDSTTGAGFACASDEVVHGNYALKFSGTPGADIMKNLTATGEALTYDFMVHSWVRDANQLRGGHVPLVKSLSQWWGYACRGYGSQFSYFQGGADYAPWPSNSSGSSNQWFEMNIGLSMSTDEIHGWKNGSYMGTLDLIASNGISVPDDLFQIGFGQQSGYVTWWDDTFVRKWVIDEPTHSIWGNLESMNMDDWARWKSHTIAGSNGAGNNYQVRFSVNYGYGVDTGESVFCDYQCQPDFDDIRFTDDDGQTLLDYWLEEYTAYDSAIFWVEILDNLDEDVTIRMYYGNPNCDSESDGSATFIFFDDFENGNLDRWTVHDSMWTIDDTIQRNGDYCAWANTFTSLTDRDLSKDITISTGVMIHSWARIEGFHNWPIHPTADNGHAVYAVSMVEADNVQYYQGVEYIDWPANNQYTFDTWHRFEVGFSFSEDAMYAWKDNLAMHGSGPVDLRDDTGGFIDGFSKIKTICSRYVDHDMWLDDYYVRKWIVNEPTHSLWTDEIFVWHHDCSNTTGFVYDDSWNINWMDWSIVGGTISSDSDNLSVTSVDTGTLYHGPVFEYELPHSLLLRDINNFTALFDVDNSLTSYVGYHVLMLGDADRNPVLFFSFSDGWSDYTQGAYGISYVFENGSRSGYGSGYPITWTSFTGSMNVTYTEEGLQAGVEGLGNEIISGLNETDYNREIKYIAIASAAHGSSPRFQVLIDEIYLNHHFAPEDEPEINDVEDMEFEAGVSGKSIKWYIKNFIPIAYELYRNEGLLLADFWPGGTEIEFVVDFLSPGVYNYTIIVIGEGDISVTDTVIVTVTDSTNPIIGHPYDITYEYGSTDNTIIWAVSDLYPDTYTLYKDGFVIDDGTWTSGSITQDIDGESLGIYNYTMVIIDDYDNNAKDTVMVTVVDTTDPILNHPADIVVDMGTLDIEIVWQATDYLPFVYEIYQNDTLVATSSWVSGENISYAIADDLAPGIYNITVKVWDTSGNYDTDTVFVVKQEAGGLFTGDILVIGITIGSLVVIVVISGLICKNRGAGQSGVSEYYYG